MNEVRSRPRRAERIGKVLRAVSYSKPFEDRITTMPTSTRFTDGTFAFLKDLAKHNNRTWFRANEARYRDSVLQPTLEFIRSVAPRLPSLSRELVADDRPVGGSMMRMHRDIRFSRDKSPYRTTIGIRFIHQKATMTEPHIPGFFLDLAPGDSWVYAGMWKPETSQLRDIRSGIVKRPKEWAAVRADVGEIEGTSLKRPPRGIDSSHPFVDDLKRKAFFSGREIPGSTVVRSDFPARFVRLCQELNPLNRFLAKSIGIPY